MFLPDAGRNYPHPGLGCGPFLCQHAGQALWV
jgi:hypothetical protein